MTAPIVYQVLVPGALVFFGLMTTIMGFLIKNAIFKKIDHLEKKIDDLVERNAQSHKEMWVEIGIVRERLAKLEP